MMDRIDPTRLMRRRTLAGFLPLVLGIWLPACSAAAGDSATKDNPNQVVAKINGQSITEADVRASAKDNFDQLDRDYRQQKQDLLESKLRAMLDDRLLTMEAEAQKTTKDALLAQLKGTDVTDAEVDKFYEENKSQMPRPKDQIAPQIKSYLAGEKLGEARTKYIATLESKFKAQIMIEPVRQQVASAGFPTKGGGAQAAVTIVEFSDFQCPFCSRLNPTLEQVMANYGDKVRVVFREFPLPIHNNAPKAAEAALCANEQGKFWQMHDAMFKDQQGLSVDGLKAKAAAAGLDKDAFNSCLDSGKEADAVKVDLKAGQEAGVNGTPAMFINGRFLNGAQPYNKVSQLIDDELKRKGQGK
jgi:protein-disulfide isomerase